jgi:hypothetical protein
MLRFKKIIETGVTASNAADNPPAQATRIDESGIDEKPDHARQCFLGKYFRHPVLFFRVSMNQPNDKMQVRTK